MQCLISKDRVIVSSIFSIFIARRRNGIVYMVKDCKNELNNNWLISFVIDAVYLELIDFEAKFFSELAISIYFSFIIGFKVPKSIIFNVEDSWA